MIKYRCVPKERRKCGTVIRCCSCKGMKERTDRTSVSSHPEISELVSELLWWKISNLNFQIWCCWVSLLNNPLTSKRRFHPSRIDLWTDPISPRRRLCSAGLHAVDTLWHACIDFLTYSDDMSEWRAVAIEHARKICGSTDHFQQFWMTTDVKGLTLEWPGWWIPPRGRFKLAKIPWVSEG